MIGLPARSPASQSLVRRAGASAKAGVWRVVMMLKKILILGSSNVDLILGVPRFNNPGETIRAENLTTVYGGKGANQAIAAKQLGAESGPDHQAWR